MHFGEFHPGFFSSNDQFRFVGTHPGVYEIVEQTKKALFQSSGVEATITKASANL